MRYAVDYTTKLLKENNNKELYINIIEI